MEDRGKDLGGMDEQAARLIHAHAHTHRFTQTNARVLRVQGAKCFTRESEKTTTGLFKSRKLETERSRGSWRRIRT